jgi:hypothetical protein
MFALAPAFPLPKKYMLSFPRPTTREGQPDGGIFEAHNATS